MLYITEAEMRHNRANDPLDKFRKGVLGRSLLTEKELARIDAEVEATVEEAVEFAEGSPMPDLVQVRTDVYVNYP
jgi:pyruvate dehydrogenase E1 component alpha subunit